MESGGGNPPTHRPQPPNPNLNLLNLNPADPPPTPTYHRCVANLPHWHCCKRLSTLTLKFPVTFVMWRIFFVANLLWRIFHVANPLATFDSTVFTNSIVNPRSHEFEVIRTKATEAKRTKATRELNPKLVQRFPIYAALYPLSYREVVAI